MGTKLRPGTRKRTAERGGGFPMNKILIFGSGPHGRMTAETVIELGLEAVFLTYNWGKAF
jgi:hypothetical protein